LSERCRIYLSKKSPKGAAELHNKCIKTPKGAKSSERRRIYPSKKVPKGVAGLAQ
jgi:hypothetical protein